MFHTVVECGQELEKYFEEPANREDVLDVKEVLARFTTDVIASCAFGIQCNCLRNPDAEFRRWGRKTFEPSLNQNLRDIINFMMPRLAIALRIANIPSDISKFFMKVVDETVAYRERNSVTRDDFMQLLIQLKNHGYLDTDIQDNEKVQSEYCLKLYNRLDTFYHLVYYITFPKVIFFRHQVEREKKKVRIVFRGNQKVLLLGPAKRKLRFYNWPTTLRFFSSKPFPPEGENSPNFRKVVSS
jgi:hypothetical protein